MNDPFFVSPGSGTEGFTGRPRVRPGGRRTAWLLGSAVGLLALVPLVAAAQAPSTTPAQRFVEEERLRAAAEAAFSLYYQRADDGHVKNDNRVTAAGMLAELGEPAVPLLVKELQQASAYNFTFVAQALGLIGGPRAEAALREAVVESERSTNSFATTRRAWACYALALQGHLDALDLLNGPDHLAAGYPMHRDMSVLEVSGLLLAPESVPVLHAQLDRYSRIDKERAAQNAEGQPSGPDSPPDAAQDPGAASMQNMLLKYKLGSERLHVIKALRRLAHEESLPKILALLEDEDQAVRREAADALHVYDKPEVIRALMRRLEVEPLPHVRFASAWSLRQLAPHGLTAEFLELLDKEYDVHVRGSLYRLAAIDGKETAFEALKKHLGRPDSRDRDHLAAAMARFDDPRATNIVRAALNDRDVNVIRTGAEGLRHIGGEKATQALLDQVPSERWDRARWALHHLTALRDDRAIPLVIGRLTRELERAVQDPVVREHSFGLGDALIALRYRGDVDMLREGIARQTDGQLRNYLAAMVKQLQALKNNGDDVSRWSEAVADDDPKIRRLAYAVLGELGGESAAKVLVSAFGRVERDEGVDILRALGGVDTDSSRTLLERVLTQPAFDPYPRLVLREMAAYSARRLGGKRMAEALETAVTRRRGRDAKVLLSLLLLEGEAALPVYEKFQVERLRYIKASRGPEQETFQRLVGDLRAGRSLAFYDRPPDAFDFKRPR